MSAAKVAENIAVYMEKPSAATVAQSYGIHGHRPTLCGEM